jgi:hypothetical protein
MTRVNGDTNRIRPRLRQAQNGLRTQLCDKIFGRQAENGGQIEEVLDFVVGEFAIEEGINWPGHPEG